MKQPDVTALTRIAKEKARLADEEAKLFADLRSGLAAAGYRLEPVDAAPNHPLVPSAPPVRVVSGISRRVNSGAPRGPVTKKARPFSCASCGRSFERAMHLGRHMSTVHARKRS
jgi:hypothetical protein